MTKKRRLSILSIKMGCLKLSSVYFYYFVIPDTMLQVRVNCDYNSWQDGSGYEESYRNYRINSALYINICDLSSH